MNTTKITALILGAFLLSGCLYRFQYFVHEPTNKYRIEMKFSAFEKVSEFVRNGVLFIPDITEMSDDGPGGRPFLVMYSRESTKVVIEKVEILNGKTPTLTVDVNQSVAVSNPNVEDGLYYGSLLINLNDPQLRKNIDAAIQESFRSNSLNIKLYIHQSNGDKSEIEFEMKSKRAADVAWAT